MMIGSQQASHGKPRRRLVARALVVAGLVALAAPSFVIPAAHASDDAMRVGVLIPGSKTD